MVVGLTTSGAYAIGALARAAVVHAKIERLAGAAVHGFSDHALEETTADPAALAIAHRFDPYVDDDTQKEDRLAAYADSLEARRGPARQAHDGSPLLARASYTPSSPAVTPAQPFRLRGALQASRDLECLTQAVYYEARGEGAAGQAAVAQVVLNRTRHPSFPKTVCGVVFQGAKDGGCQFSFACDGSVGHKVENHAWSRAEKVAARALDGFVMPDVGNATHFHVAKLSPNWGPRLMKVAQIGAHVFYRFGGRAGSARAFDDTPEASPLEVKPVETKPVYASLALAPFASSVANSVANTVAAGAELVMNAATSKANAATRLPTMDTKLPIGVVPATPAAPAVTPPTSLQAQPALVMSEPTKVASAS